MASSDQTNRGFADGRPFRVIVLVVAFFGLATTLYVREATHPVQMSDYSVFYLGARVASEGAWGDLYPTPREGAAQHPGWPDGSDAKPRYQALADESGIDPAFRFIYPPPAAVLVAPFAAFPYRTSLVVWWAASAVAGWLTAVLAGEVYAHRTGRRRWVWAALVIGASCSPLVWSSVRVANTSVFTGAAVAAMVWGMVTSRGCVAGVGLFVGAAFKFATIPLLIVPLFLSRFRTTGWAVGTALALTVLSTAVTGVGPWAEFVALFPKLGTANDYPINLSLRGLLAHALPPDAPPLVNPTLTVLTLVSLAAVIVGLVRNRKAGVPADVLAGASATLGWFLTFAPTTQTHYFVYLIPLWGYYLADCRQNWVARVAAVVVIGGTCTPVGGGWRNLPDMLHYHMLWSAVAAFGFGVYRLFRLPAPQPRDVL